jgi:hypothetical protein
MVVDEITDCLHSRPPQGSLPKQIPGRRRQLLYFAIAAPQQEYQGLFGKLFYRMLLRGTINDVMRTIVSNDRFSRYCQPAAGRR